MKGSADDDFSVRARESTAFYFLQASICPVQKVGLKVQSESVGPNQAGVHNGDPEVSSQCGSLDFGIGTPVSPIHVPSARI